MTSNKLEWTILTHSKRHLFSSNSTKYLTPINTTAYPTSFKFTKFQTTLQPSPTTCCWTLALIPPLQNENPAAAPRIIWRARNVLVLATLMVDCYRQLLASSSNNTNYLHFWQKQTKWQQNNLRILINFHNMSNSCYAVNRFI